mgnify:FL=1
MLPSELVNDLIQKYAKRSLNEADTRFKIIDEVLEKILAWPRGPIALEVYINGNRADYVLHGKNSKPILVIESKKTGKYFELPKNLNGANNYQKITVDKLLTDKYIKEAIFQVKEYCEDLGCNYGCICNGEIWIFFNINSSYAPWKKQPAYVIKNLKFFSENFTTPFNVFGYENIINNSSLKYNIGTSRQLHSEVFYPKSSITAYNMPVNSNKYASILNSLSRKYLSNIPFDDKEFFNSCYVTNKGHYDDLQKNVHGVIYDSLTPFFRSEGVKDVYDNNRGGGFALKIEEIMRRENLDNVMILFGGRGSGKSTFIKRLLFHLRPPEIVRFSETCVIDLIYSAQTPDELTNEIWNKVKSEIDKKDLLGGDKAQLIELFSDKYSIYEKQVLNGLEKTSIEYQKLLNDFIKETLNDTKYCCQVLSRYWKNHNKGLIIVLDNLDQLRPELQDICFLNSVEIAKKLGCLVIISMREERYYNAKAKGVLDAYHVPGFHINSPVIPDVIAKRIIYILRKLNLPEVQREIGIKDQKQFTIIENFMSICLKEVRRVNSDLSLFLRYSTHGDVRQALSFFKEFLTSGYTNIDEMAVNRSWTLKIHQVIKPMMIPNRFFYDEKNSQVPNIYQLRNEINSSHFCGLRILNKMQQRSYDKASSGFIDVKYLLQIFDTTYDLKEDCIKHLDIFLTKGILESNNRLEEFNENVDQIRITSFGAYILDFLAYENVYLDLVSLDCGVFDETLANYLIKAAEKEVDFTHHAKLKERVESRIERVSKFIDYLEVQEKKEFEDLSLPESEPKFVHKLKERFEENKENILNSLKKRRDNN